MLSLNNTDHSLIQSLLQAPNQNPGGSKQVEADLKSVETSIQRIAELESKADEARRFEAEVARQRARVDRLAILAENRLAVLTGSEPVTNNVNDHYVAASAKPYFVDGMRVEVARESILMSVTASGGNRLFADSYHLTVTDGANRVSNPLIDVTLFPDPLLPWSSLRVCSKRPFNDGRFPVDAVDAMNLTQEQRQQLEAVNDGPLSDLTPEAMALLDSFGDKLPELDRLAELLTANEG